MTTTAPPQAETAAPPAGRGGYRGSRGNGRGGYSHRGGRGGHHSKSARSNNDDVENAVPALEPESDDVARLRAKYGDAGQLSQLQAMFQDWSDEDLLNVLAESAGQVELAVARITEGHAVQFSSVKSKKVQRNDSARQPPSSSAPSGPSGTQNARQPQQEQAATADGTAQSGTAGVPSSGPTGRGRGFGPGRGGPRGAFTGRGRGDGFRGARGGRGGPRGGFKPQANGHAESRAEAAAQSTTDGEASSAQADKTVQDGPAEATPAATASSEAKTTETAPATKSNGIQSNDAVDGQAKPISAAAKGKGPAIRPQPSTKMSWAQIARPQPPPAPKAVPQPSPPKSVQQEASAPTTTENPAPQIGLSAADEKAPLLETENSAPSADSAQTQSQPDAAASRDPWASTPAAVNPAEPEVPALGVGEGWADSIIASNDVPSTAPADVEQHKRAEEAIPPTGVNPAGPLDVHTPVPDALPSQQPAFNQPSALAQPSVAQKTEKLSAPPGLSKRTSSRMQSDAAVTMPGPSPDVSGMGVQFGSLNLFGSAQPEAEEPVQSRQSASQAPSSTSLYNASTQSQQTQTSDVSLQHDGLSAIEQPPTQYSSYQQDAQSQLQQQPHQAQIQQQQPAASAQTGYGQERTGGLPGIGYGSGTSAYASRYPQTQQAPYQQPQQHNIDPFAALTGASQIQQHQQQPSQQSHYMGQNALSQYFAQQAQQQQNQSVLSSASPAPGNARDVGTNPNQQSNTNASAYGGFTSAIGQPQQQHQQGGYSGDYASFYQDQLRTFYGQYDQQANNQTSARQDDDSKQGGTASPFGGVGTHQQSNQQQSQLPQQQQQQYPPNMMPPYGYPYYHYGMHPSYGQQGMNPGYGGYSQYNAYPGYGQQGNQALNGASSGRQYSNSGNANGSQQQQQHSQLGNQQATGYRGYGGNASAAPGMPHPSAYGAGGYGGFNDSRNNSLSQQGQGVGNNQDSRNSNNKDMFGDRFFSQNY